jgi:epoxyqueuosine reductase
MRGDPNLFFPGVRSILCVAVNYFHAFNVLGGGQGESEDPPSESGARVDRGVASRLRVGRYAWGWDYHDILRGKLKALLAWLQAAVPGIRGRVAVDTAPVLERHWAEQAGLGWIGRHGCLIVPGLGSWVFLGELFVDVPLPTGEPQARRCGECRRCLEACPGGALRENGPMDARRCISYWTIEHREAFPQVGMPRIEPWLFGCDICQEVCPWNRTARSARMLTLGPYAEVAAWRDLEWRRLGAEAFERRFARTSLARAGYEVVQRNLDRIAGEREGRG